MVPWAGIADSSSIAASHPTESTMFQRILHRAFSFALAAVVTAGMLGGIDGIFQPDEGSPQWAQTAGDQRA
jgi:hypothetical protein